MKQMLVRYIFLLLVLFCAQIFTVQAADRHTPIVDAVARARDAVVNIRTEKIVQRRGNPFFGFGDSLFDEFFEDMFPTRSYKTQSLGSGVIIDAEGHILTNAHVVDKASKIYVALAEESRELEAELLGQDSRIDLAVLKIVEPGPYPFLPPADSNDLLLGETVIAIGNPLGLGHSITTGIVSSLKRRVQLGKQYSSVFIQTDALINPGNSGGPLININGELIGINTAIARQAQGIGFSIPIDTAKRVVSDLIEYGQVRRGFLGIDIGDVSGNFVRSYGDGGILVEEVEPASPAATAGLQVADVILKVDGVKVASVEHFLSFMQTYTPGDNLELVCLRGAEERTLNVRLTTLPDGYQLAYTRRVFGFDLSEAQRGLTISQIIADTAADRVGLEAGDLLVEVDGIPVKSLDDYSQVIEDQLGRKPLTFTIVRGNRGYVVRLPDGH